MKKIICTAVSALALAAFAEGVNSTEFGVLTVPSAAKETIVSVPWLESGTGNEDVTVSNLVLTAGLANGAHLKLYNGGWEQGWVLSGGKWVGADVATQSGSSFSGNDQTTIARGRGVMLTRADGDTGTKFYIMGKPSTDSGFVDLPQGYSLIAPPFTTATDVNSLTWTGGAAISPTKDSLMVPTGDAKGSFVTLSYVGGKWKKWTGSAWQEGYTIPAGMGAWFINGESSAKKVSWN